MNELTARSVCPVPIHPSERYAQQWRREIIFSDTMLWSKTSPHRLHLITFVNEIEIELRVRISLSLILRLNLLHTLFSPKKAINRAALSFFLFL